MTILIGGMVGFFGAFCSFAVVMFSANLGPLVLVPLFFSLMPLGLVGGLMAGSRLAR